MDCFNIWGYKDVSSIENRKIRVPNFPLFVTTNEKILGGAKYRGDFNYVGDDVLD